MAKHECCRCYELVKDCDVIFTYNYEAYSGNIKAYHPRCYKEMKDKENGTE